VEILFFQKKLLLQKPTLGLPMSTKKVIDKTNKTQEVHEQTEQPSTYCKFFRLPQVLLLLCMCSRKSPPCWCIRKSNRRLKWNTRQSRMFFRPT